MGLDTSSCTFFVKGPLTGDNTVLYDIDTDYYFSNVFGPQGAVLVNSGLLVVNNVTYNLQSLNINEIPLLNVLIYENDSPIYGFTSNTISTSGSNYVLSNPTNFLYNFSAVQTNKLYTVNFTLLSGLPLNTNLFLRGKAGSGEIPFNLYTAGQYHNDFKACDLYVQNSADSGIITLYTQGYGEPSYPPNIGYIPGSSIMPLVVFGPTTTSGNDSCHLITFNTIQSGHISLYTNSFLSSGNIPLITKAVTNSGNNTTYLYTHGF